MRRRFSPWAIRTCPYLSAKSSYWKASALRTSLVGEWTVEGDRARQTDPEAFFAKLAAPLVQEDRTFTYSFAAKSEARGRGWVGVGIHLFTPASYTLKGYGSGDSICVWLTRDPVHYLENPTRLQIYRSADDWNMDLVSEVPVAESIYDDNSFEVTVDPVAGTVSVSMDGTERLVAKGVSHLKKGLYVDLQVARYRRVLGFSASRPLNNAEFQARP
jgi:hypothetical protein